MSNVATTVSKIETLLKQLTKDEVEEVLIILYHKVLDDNPWFEIEPNDKKDES